jgi:N-acetylmuramoyl-L-alanine amidase/V8-like Glu-specific endopeptidase
MVNAAQLPVVTLDAGHGGQTKVGGSSSNNASGPNGLLEKDVALDVAQRTASKLDGRARVVLTRSGDVNLSLVDRASAARNSGSQLFLSIHFNGAHDPTVDGSAVWVARAAGHDSADLADAVLGALTQATGAPDRGVQRADLGVLLPARHASTTAACLVEVAFLTNPDEAAKLSGAAYRDRLADALATAITSHLERPALPSPSRGFGQGLGASSAFSSRYARAAAIVEPDIDYSATSLDDANRIWQDWLARYADWSKGVPDSVLTIFPHAAICQLRLYDSSGNLAYGTGFYIANEVLLTCGHNFLDSADGWTTTRVEVQPGHSPIMSTLATKTFDVIAADVVHPNWRDRSDSTHDLAVLRVPGLAATAGTFTPANRSLGPNEGIVVCGYGKVDGQDYESQGQRMDGAHISEADTDMVYYPIQTVGGHSGSPVFSNATVIGVHTGPRQSAGGAVNPHQNRAVLLNPEKIDWINSKAGTTFGQSLGAVTNGYGVRPRAYALTDENSPQADQSAEVRHDIASSLRQAESNARFDMLEHNDNRVNFGIASWTGPEIADLMDVYAQVAQENGTTQQLFDYFGGQANFTGIRDRFRQQGTGAVLTAAEETQLRQLGADTTLQEAQTRKLDDDIQRYLTGIGSHGNPWYPWIDGGMGAISEVAAHVLVHAIHQSGAAGLRRVLAAVIRHFGGETSLGNQMVAGTVTEQDFLAQVGEQVALGSEPGERPGVRNRYRTLLQNWGTSRLSFYFNPTN